MATEKNDNQKSYTGLIIGLFVAFFVIIFAAIIFMHLTSSKDVTYRDADIYALAE